jgi:hypothetical protein
MVTDMVDTNKTSSSSKDETSAQMSAIETARENMIRTVDEIAKAQPQYLQSFSNLQLEQIQTTKNIIQTAFSAQKQIASTWNAPTLPYTDLFVRPASEMTNTAVRAIGINNQLAISALDAARENLKIYNRAVDAATEYNTNLAKAWTAFASQMQQQFTR